MENVSKKRCTQRSSQQVVNKQRKINGPAKSTIDLLPDKLLAVIFQCLDVREQLQLSKVCKKWFNVVQNEPGLLQATILKVTKTKLKKMMENATTLMRTYRTIKFSYGLSKNLSNIEISLLANVEIAIFSSACFFGNSSALMEVLKHCKKLKECKIESEIQDSSEIIKPYLKPVRLSIESALCQSVKCFANVAHLEVRYWIRGVRQPERVAQLVKDYAPAITSIDITEQTLGFLGQMTEIEDLHLKTINLCHFDRKYFPMMTRFFRQQQPFATKFTTKYSLENADDEDDESWGLQLINRDFFDVMRVTLSNLEVVKIQIDYKKMLLNDLHVLPNLRRLTVSLSHVYGSVFMLNIEKLMSLTHFSIIVNDSTAYSYDEKTELIVKPPVQPMSGLKILKIRDLEVSRKTINAFHKFMPNLEELYIDFNRVMNNHFLTDSFKEMNQLVHLKILGVNGYLINEKFLQSLKLPELHQFVFIWEFSFDCKVFATLVKNCPKLTTLMYKKFGSSLRNKSSRLIATKTNVGKLKVVQNLQWVGNEMNSDELNSTDDESAADPKESDEDFSDSDEDAIESDEGSTEGEQEMECDEESAPSTHDSIYITEPNNSALLEKNMENNNLHLKSINLHGDDPKFLSMAKRFFRQQQPFAKEFSTKSREKYYQLAVINANLFDTMRVTLTNLEVIKIRIDCGANIHLNDLRVLTHLRLLTVKVNHANEPFYELDVGQLVALTHLSVSAKNLELIVKPMVQPMPAMKMLKVKDCLVDNNTIDKFAKLMPNLEELYLDVNSNNLDGAFVEINQWVHLKTLGGGSNLVCDSLLKNLKLPHLCEMVFIDDFSFNRPSLKYLVKNCPNLTEIWYNMDGQSKKIEESMLLVKKTKSGKLHLIPTFHTTDGRYVDNERMEMD